MVGAFIRANTVEVKEVESIVSNTLPVLYKF